MRLVLEAPLDLLLISVNSAHIRMCIEACLLLASGTGQELPAIAPNLILAQEGVVP